MLRLHLGPADLCRVRFADRLHPVGTTMLACQALHDPTVAGMAPDLAERAGAATGVSAAASSLRHLLPSRGRLPDFLTPFDGLESVAAGLAAIRATPAHRVRTEVTAAYAKVTATRAAVLRRLAEPGRHTTTALARAVAISLSSASEHATALRAAGLITTDRAGGAVRHRLTPLGAHLLGEPAGAAVTDGP